MRPAAKTPTITYELVTAAPVQAIVDLYEAGGWWKESDAARAAIPAMIRGSYAFLVARLDGRIVGMGRAISDGASDAYIQDVVVLREHRGRGVGRELVKRLAEHCRENKIAWIGLIAEPGTKGFYESLGFGSLEGYQPLLYRQR